MRSAQFTAFLATHGGTPGAAEESDSGHCAWAARAEQALGLNLDNADLGAEGVAALASRAQAKDSSLDAPHVQAALDAYSQFLAYYRAR